MKFHQHVQHHLMFQGNHKKHMQPFAQEIEHVQDRCPSSVLSHATPTKATTNPIGQQAEASKYGKVDNDVAA